MDHTEIEDGGLVALYRRGLLPEDEELRFEEHFFTCATCQEELEHQRRLELGLAAMRAEDAASAAGSAASAMARERPANLVRFPARATLGWLALAASLLLALPLGWLLANRGHLVRDVAGWRERARASEHERDGIARRLTESERQRHDLEGRLAAMTGRQPAPPPPPDRLADAGLPRPLAATPLLLLTRLRSGDPEGANRLAVERSSPLVQIAVDAGSAAAFASYRVTVTDAAGRTLYTARELHPNALEVILLTFPGDFFAAGTYVLILEGERPDGKREPIERYGFQVAGR